MDQAEVVKGEGGLAEGVVAADGEKWSQLEIRITGEDGELNVERKEDREYH